MRRSIAPWLLGTAVLVPTAEGCSSSSSPHDPVALDAGGACPATTDAIQRTILVPRCGLSGCHEEADPAQGLDLVSPDLESRIVGVVGVCERPIVTPGEPNESYLITKVSRREPSCGVTMPFDGTPLSKHDVSCLVAWVTRLTAATPSDMDAAPLGGDASSGDGGAGGAGGADAGRGGAGGQVSTNACAPGKVRCGSTCVTAFEPTFDAIYTTILKRSCVFTSCHGGTAPKEQLGFGTADDAFANLVGVASQQRPDLLRVDPSHPEGSYIVDKLRGIDLGPVTTTGVASQAMPLPPSKPLCEPKIAAVEEWIRQGAPR
jgi:hypothetical protein